MDLMKAMIHWSRGRPWMGTKAEPMPKIRKTNERGYLKKKGRGEE